VSSNIVYFQQARKQVEEARRRASKLRMLEIVRKLSEERKKKEQEQEVDDANKGTLGDVKFKKIKFL